MKKSLIALAVLAASGAVMAQSSVTLYGVVDLGVGRVDYNPATLGVKRPNVKTQMHGNAWAEALRLVLIMSNLLMQKMVPLVVVMGAKLMCG